MSEVSTLSEICERYKLSRTHLYERHIRPGLLRVTKFGRRSLILAEDEAAWREALPKYQPEGGR